MRPCSTPSSCSRPDELAAGGRRAGGSGAGAAWLPTRATARRSWASTRSGSGDEFCVEVRITDSTVGVRDSKNQAGSSFIVPHSAWTHFIDTTKRRVQHSAEK